MAQNTTITEESSSHIIGGELDDTNEHTDNDQDDGVEEIDKIRNYRKAAKIYISTSINFETEEEAVDKLKNEMVFNTEWTRLNTYNNVIWYKCKKCAARLQLKLNLNEKWVIFIEKEAINEEQVHEHEEHDELEETVEKYKVPKNVKDRIIKLYCEGSFPQQILETLRSDNIQIEKKQINYIIRNDKLKRLGKCQFNIQDLINFAKENSTIPEDEDEVFVSDYEYELDPERNFRIFMTTPRLIQLTQHVSFT
jgi:hypothetical protein